mmetsp:Transcript_22866/g.77898  ORF Transcript_22866/g.77898 Transcript_22866/m.77898 type:complete len:226 (-) Transcript_22866:352-1029(-)
MAVGGALLGAPDGWSFAQLVGLSRSLRLAFPSKRVRFFEQRFCVSGAGPGFVARRRQRPHLHIATIHGGVCSRATGRAILRLGGLESLLRSGWHGPRHSAELPRFRQRPRRGRGQLRLRADLCRVRWLRLRRATTHAPGAFPRPAQLADAGAGSPGHARRRVHLRASIPTSRLGVGHLAVVRVRRLRGPALHDHRRPVPKRGGQQCDAHLRRRHRLRHSSGLFSG